MKFVFASYVVTNSFKNPESWLYRTRMYNGIFESLSVNHEVISVEQIDYEGEYLKNGVSYNFMRLGLPSKYFPDKLHNYIKKQQPDIVVIQGLHFPLQVMRLRLKLGRKTKIILHHHAERPFTGLKKYLQRWADRYIDAYLFASRDMGMDWITKGNLASPQKIREVMEVSSVFYPIEKIFAKSKTGIIADTVYLWVGRLNENKDPLTVVKAFLQFAPAKPGAILYMIYHTDELFIAISELLNEHPYKKNLVLVGKVPNEDLLYWYNSADFIVSGSHYEGSGTAIAEAMSCGCIPLVTDIFSFRMITDNGKCGLLYEAGNEEALLRVLIKSEQIDRAEKRETCLNYFHSNLSFNAIAGKIQEIAGSL